MRTSNFFGKKVVVANFAMAIFGWGIGFLWAANIHVCRHPLIMFNASNLGNRSSLRKSRVASFVINVYIVCIDYELTVRKT